MENRKLDTWDEFRGVLEEIRARYPGTRPGTGIHKDTAIFRGLADADWRLMTTLERTSSTVWSVSNYLLSTHKCLNELESFTGRKWGLPDWPAVSRQIQEEQDSSHFPMPCFDYLVYLRHHGFPSPLLDWTMSPYVAAYFAFFAQPPSTASRVAIYAFVSSPSGFKMWGGGDSRITQFGRYVTTDARHFAQKAVYTVSTRWDEENETHYYTSHQDVFDKAPSDQDHLWKITLPVDERIRALRELSDYNINHFTLFQSEDGLVQSLAINEFELG